MEQAHAGGEYYNTPSNMVKMVGHNSVRIYLHRHRHIHVLSLRAQGEAKGALSIGNSPEPNKILTIYDYALLVKDFIEKQNIISPTIIAHSFGGRLTAILQGYYKLSFNKIIFESCPPISKIVFTLG